MADSRQREAAGERGASPRSSKKNVSADDAADAAASSQDRSSSPDAHGVGAAADGREADVLAAAFTSLFTNFAKVVQGELECSNSEYELLKEMNVRTAVEYDNFSDFASGLRVFVERMKEKNDALIQLLKEVDGIDRSVTELEVLVSTLDNYTKTLYAQMMAAFADNQ